MADANQELFGANQNVTIVEAQITRTMDNDSHWPHKIGTATIQTKLRK